MPELPEVEVTRRGITPYITGRVISAAVARERRLRWPVPLAFESLSGRVVRAVRSARSAVFRWERNPPGRKRKKIDRAYPQTRRIPRIAGEEKNQVRGRCFRFLG